jgi:alpha-L-fucosidase 2
MRLLLLLFVVSSLAGVPAVAADDVIWYDHPGNHPTSEGLPIGNGRLGGSVLGGAARDDFQFNEDSLWTGTGKSSENDFGAFGAYQDFGDVLIWMPGQEKRTNYRRELHFGDALAKESYLDNGVNYAREYFASHPAGVIVMHFTADQPGSLTGSIQLKDAHDAPTMASNGNRLTSTGALPNGLKYESQLLVLNENGKLSIGSDASGLLEIKFTGCDSLTLILDAGTDYAPDAATGFRGEDPHARLTKQIDAAAAQTYDQLKTGHEKDFHALYDRVALDLGKPGDDVEALPTDKRIRQVATKDDPELEQLLFQYGRYTLISCSRQALPANLQGLWNDNNKPQWACDYHSNINLQMNYWGAEPGNIAECTLPLFAWMQSMLPPWREATAASKEFKLPSGAPVRGWAVRTMLNPFGGGTFTWDKTANAWLCQHLWDHYAFGGDKGYLRDTAYPMMKETCEFWQDHLKTLPDGRLVVPNGWSPEHGPHEDGVSYNQEILWDLFDNYVHAADALGVDKDERDTIAAMRDKLVTPKIGKWGQLQEWMEDKDDPKDHHRHASHLFAVFPGHQISPVTTPELAAAAAKSLDARGLEDDNRHEWVWTWRAAMWARLGDAEKAHARIVDLLHYNVSPNLIGAYPWPNQLDSTFGITGAMSEMLLQSQAGEINLLPALPGAWPAGSVKGLRARGGFEVAIVWEKGQLKTATITSVTGTACRVRYKDKTVDLKLAPGASETLEATRFR